MTDAAEHQALRIHRPDVCVVDRTEKERAEEEIHSCRIVKPLQTIREGVEAYKCARAPLSARICVVCWPLRAGKRRSEEGVFLYGRIHGERGGERERERESAQGVYFDTPHRTHKRCERTEKSSRGTSTTEGPECPRCRIPIITFQFRADLPSPNHLPREGYPTNLAWALGDSNGAAS